MSMRLRISRIVLACMPALMWAGSASAAPDASKLIEAVKAGDARAVRTLLLGHAAVDAAESDGSTALHWAAQLDNFEIVNLLIGAGPPSKP